MQDIKNIIKSAIETATSAVPVTSTRLIEIIRRETGATVSARKIRFIVADLREQSKLPILATRKGAQGYFLAQSIAEVEDYEREVRNHALRELTTIKQIKADYFGSKQTELLFI